MRNHALDTHRACVDFFAEMASKSCRAAPAAFVGERIAGMLLRCTVNGEAVELDVSPRLLLSDFIRHELKLTGTHVGCEMGVCGACTVIVDGAPVRSCLMFAAQADRCEVRTVEVACDGRKSVIPAGGIQPASRASVRLLHARRADDAAGRARTRDLAANRSGSARPPLRQPVPLHRLPGHGRRSFSSSGS